MNPARFPKARPLIARPNERRPARWSLWAGETELCCCFGGHWTRREAVECPVALRAFLKLGGTPENVVDED